MTSEDMRVPGSALEHRDLAAHWRGAAADHGCTMSFLPWAPGAGRAACRTIRRGRIGSRGLVLLPPVVGIVWLGGWASARVLEPKAHRPGAHAPLRVCADPNNMPFSNAKGEGFENRIAALIARDLGTTVEYTWWPQRRGWVRNTINARTCDLVMGVPARFDPLLTTRPYYQSAYVFVSRTDRHYAFQSLDDPRLRTLRIGLHFIGDDYTNPPPAHALGARGLVRNIVGYSIYGNYARPNPPARLIDAVARGDVDVAIAWGPLAGYFARHEPVPLTVSLVQPLVDRTGMRFAFPIAMGVHRGNTALRDELQRVLDRQAREVHRILDRYGVPLVGDEVGRTALPTAR
ncbi:MAG TPA: substrate-binding domain-containing protein [Gemmatimonadaceae bacterium]|nr:substrate-binding domain-containing protein [Gemmatimonadaceae bacterium]